MNGTGGLASRPARVVQAILRTLRTTGVRGRVVALIAGSETRSPTAQLCDGSQSRRWRAPQAGGRRSVMGA
jgi:hypothetical protein